jgi:hypothetical protein
MHLIDNGSGDYAPIYGYDSPEEFMEAGEEVACFEYLGMWFASPGKLGEERQYLLHESGSYTEGLALCNWIVGIEARLDEWKRLAEWVAGAYDRDDADTFTQCLPASEKSCLYEAALEAMRASGEWEDAEVQG